MIKLPEVIPSLGCCLLLLSPPVYSEDPSRTGEVPSNEASAPAANTSQSKNIVSKNIVSKNIVRALLTTAIANREPVDEIASLDKNRERIYFFTEFSGLKGKVIKHRWEYKDQPQGEVSFNVGSDQWHCYSSKNLSPEWTGIWTVSVIDEKNNVLTRTQFEITE